MDWGKRAVIGAYRYAWEETRSLDAAYRAATAEFRRLNPDFTDPALIEFRVALWISGAIPEVLRASHGPAAAGKRLATVA